jgi:hypothetical protein
VDEAVIKANYEQFCVQDYQLTFFCLGVRLGLIEESEEKGDRAADDDDDNLVY